MEAREVSAVARPPARTRAAAATILTVALAALPVRLYRLDHFSFWLDEIMQTHYLQARSWSAMWKTLASARLDAPFGYAVGRLLELIHPSDAVRRLPAIVFGAAAVTCFGFLLARRIGPTAGVLGSLLLVFAPYHVHYSQEMRLYSLGMFLTTLALLLLDRYLAEPSWRRLFFFWVSCVVTAYSLYLAALLLAIAGTGLLAEDSFDRDPARRKAARRFLFFSPLFVLAIWIAYLPWWPVLRSAIQSAPLGDRPAITSARIGRFFNFFGFSAFDWQPLGSRGAFFAALVLGGAGLAAARPRCRFLLVWAFGGLAALEVLEQRHPVYDSIFHYLPAGMALTALSALALGELFRHRVTLLASVCILAACLVLDVRALAVYFRSGRPDWRPLASTLARIPDSERIFVENQYTQICLAHFLNGPTWQGRRELVNLEGRVEPLSYAWHRDSDAWLVLAAGPESPTLRSWASRYPSSLFPSAEGPGGAILVHLENGRR